MKTITVHKADGLGRGEVESINIGISAPIQPIKLGEGVSMNRGHLFDRDAWLIGDALIRSLPQATLERLLGFLLKARASNYLVGALVSNPSPAEAVPALLKYQEWDAIQLALNARCAQLMAGGAGCSSKRLGKLLFSAQQKLQAHARRVAETPKSRSN